LPRCREFPSCDSRRPSRAVHRHVPQASANPRSGAGLSTRETRRVAPGDCSPGAPTDPYVRTLAHTAPQIVGSRPVSAIRLCFVDTLSRARCLRRISQRRFHHSTPRFPPPGRHGRSSPTSSVLSRRSGFLPFVPRRFVAFARRYHGSTRLFSFLPTPSRAQRRARGFGYRFPRAIFSDMETTGSLKSPGDLDCLFAHVPGLRQAETTLASNASLARPPLPA